MRIWTAHLHPARPPVLVQEGWSWGAAAFGPFWLLAHRAWVPGVLVLAAVVILNLAVPGALRPVLVLGFPIFDYVHVLTRRLLEHAPLTKADKRHLHHRLLERGWNQRQIVWFIYSVAIVLCIFALVIFKAGHPSH